MKLQPASKADLIQLLQQANRPGVTVASVDLSNLQGLLWHSPEDMTAKVEAGMTLGAFQEELARRGQWLPIDPPSPERLTIARLLSENLHGPRRFGFGTIRDHLIGLQVALAEGRLVSSGGNVVKNVAGFDLMKLFIGAKESLGVPVEATFKLLPLPETECCVQSAGGTVEEAEEWTASVLDSEIAPVILDWYRAASETEDGGINVVLGFAGIEEQVRWQRDMAAKLGFKDAIDLSYEKEFWTQHGATVARGSMLPSRLAAAVRELGAGPFVARAGNGVLYSAGQRPAVPPRIPDRLSLRLKKSFDPNGILPSIPA